MTAKYNYYILLDRVICGRFKKYKGAKYIYYVPHDSLVGCQNDE